MADLKLKRVTLRNWGKFTNAELEFPESGLVMVTGMNIASGGAMQSVGSGKTIFGESFSRALLGIRGRFEHLKQFSRDKKGDTYVCVEAELLGKPLKVEMGYQCEELNPKAEGLRFSYDGGDDIERGTIAQTRAELVKLIGVPPLLSGWTVFVNGKKMDFTLLSQQDCVNLVMSALRQPPWTEYHERVKKYVRNFNKTLAKDQGAHEQATTRVQEAQADVEETQTDVNDAQAEYDEAKTAHDLQVTQLNAAINALSLQMENLDKRQTQLNKEMTKLENDKAAEHHKLEIQQRDLQESIRKLKVDMKPLLEAQQEAQRIANTADTNYLNYKNAKRVCPTCKQAIGEKLDEGQLNELAETYNQAALKKQEAEDAYGEAWTAFETKGTELQTVNDSIDELGVKYGITVLSEEYERNDRRLNELSEASHQKELRRTKLGEGPSQMVLNNAKTKLKERERVLKKAQEDLQAAAEALTLSQATERVLNYWNVAFSPYGIPNMVLREAIAPLNHEARRISASMTGGTIEVVYSTAREMASGLTEAKLNIEVNNLLGDKDLAGSSNGESGLANFIISETLSCVGQVSRRIGYRWLDEIVPHQDAKVCHSIYSYWKELAQKLGVLIFMVDHNPIAANYADQFLTVEKQGKPGSVVSSVYWK